MNEKYLEWTSHVLEDPDLTAELESVKGQEEEINDRFYRDLEFGTGGLRGVIGAGTNRMNIYTVRKATQGVADYINQNFKNGSVAISHDSRIKSDLFAKEVARVCAANGVKAYIYPELMPTPMLSFAVRALHCSMGVMITASHNPAKYNGYKAYGPDGCQITNETADAVLANILSVNEFDGVKLTDFDEGLKSGMISYIGQDVVESYYENVLKQSIHSEIVKTSGFKVVYTGSIRRANDIGFILEVARELESDGVSFFLFGDGEEKVPLERRCADEAIDNVHFMGRVDKRYIPSILSQGMLLLMHSRAQYGLSNYGMSQNKLFDYLASGKPIISNLPNSYSIINRYDCGFEGPFDTPQDCARQILRMKDDPASLERWGRNSRQAASLFTFEALTRKLSGIIDRP